MFMIATVAAIFLGLADPSLPQEGVQTPILLGGQQAFAGLSYGSNGTAVSTDFFSVTDFRHPVGFSRYPRFYVARRVIRIQGEDHVTWADSDACPALKGVLSWLDQIQPGEIAVPGMSTPLPEEAIGRPGPTVRMDGGRRRYTIWSIGWDANGDLVTLSASGSSQLLADFGDAATRRLDPCWTADQPALPTEP